MPALLDETTIVGLSGTALAYAAGFFDGEGYCEATRRWVDSHGSMVMDVQIGQNDIRVLEWLQAAYGGGIYHHPNGRFHQWVISGTRAYKFLKDVLPFLIVKAEKTQRVILDWEGRHGHR